VARVEAAEGVLKDHLQLAAHGQRHLRRNRRAVQQDFPVLQAEADSECAAQREWQD
jgi:hypothetical protein